METTLSRDKRVEALRSLLHELSSDYNLKEEEILQATQEILIPLSAFDSNLSALEIIVKYLKEEKKLSLSAISKLTQRSSQALWITYRNANQKWPHALKIEKSPFDFPLPLITQTTHSILECIVKFLKEEKQLSYAKIGRVLNRDQRTIWTVYQKTVPKKRANKKRGERNSEGKAA